MSNKTITAIPVIGTNDGRMYSIPIYVCRLVRDSAQASENKRIKAPADAATVLHQYLAGYDREAFVVLMLSTKNDVIGIHTVSIGTLNSASLRIADIFKAPIIANAAAIVCGHNHPSGDPLPSFEDVKTTELIVAAGKLLDIDVLDHVVIGDGERFVSMKERGLGFN